MDSPIIAIGKVEATRQDNSYGGYQWSYRASCPFLSAISRQAQAGLAFFGLLARRKGT